MASPLLGGRLAGPLLLLLQPPPGLLQLGERVGRGVGRHGRVLDEGVRGLHDAPQLGTDPGVHRDRPLHGDRPGQVVRQLLLCAGRTGGRGRGAHSPAEGLTVPKSSKEQAPLTPPRAGSGQGGPPGAAEQRAPASNLAMRGLGAAPLQVGAGSASPASPPPPPCPGCHPWLVFLCLLISFSPSMIHCMIFWFLSMSSGEPGMSWPLPSPRPASTFFTLRLEGRAAFPLDGEEETASA